MRHTTRWSFALLTATVQAIATAVAAGAAWVLVGLILGEGPDFAGLARLLPVLMVIYFGILLVKFKQPTLRIETDRLVVWRAGAQITLLFADYESVGKSPGPLGQDILRFRTGLIESEKPGKRLPRFVENMLRKQKVDHTLAPAQFFADWRTSELGSLQPHVRR